MNGWLIVNGFLHTKKFSELTDLFLLAAKRCGVSLTVYTNCEILVDVQEKIKEKQEEMVALIAENAKTGSYTPEFDERYRTIAEEINALKEAQKTARNEKRMADSYEQRIQDIDHYLSTSTCQIPEFDNDLVRRLISTIKVESSEKLLIQFQSGIVMEQEIRYE